MTDEKKTTDEVVDTTPTQENTEPKVDVNTEEKAEKLVESSKTEAKSDDKKDEVKEESKDSAKADDKAPAKKEGDKRNSRDNNRRGGFRKRGGNRRGRGRREKPEFEQKIVSLRRVTRVMAGGRRFSFSAAIVIGDKKGRVGFGLGKANDTSAAIEKAIRSAKKNMITLKLNEKNSISHDSQAKYKASEVFIRPVSGKGLAAGGAVRTVLELAGVDEVGGKLLTRSKNNINNSRATIEALRPFTTKDTAKAKTELARQAKDSTKAVKANKK